MFILGSLEVGLRGFWPQLPTVVNLRGGSLRLLDHGLGYRNRPNAVALHEEPEFTVEYAISAAGLRDEYDHADPKPADVTRILLVGDSFTFGEGVAYPATWPVVLERQRRGSGQQVEVIKAGVLGHDTRDEVLYLEELVSRYSPDLVVLVFLPNDLITNRPIETPDSPPPTLTPTPFLFGLTKASALHVVALAKRMVTTIDWVYARLYLFTPWVEYYRTPVTARAAEQIEVTKGLIQRANEYCRDAGASLLVLSIPQQFQVVVAANGYDLNDIAVHLPDRMLSDFAAEREIPWVPLLDTMAHQYQATGTPLFFRYNGHLNQHGHQLVGQEFARLLQVRWLDDRDGS